MGSCFSDKLKKRCSFFILFISVFLLLLGIFIAALSSKQLFDSDFESSYASFNITTILPMVQIAVGVIILVTGVLGIYAAKCRNSGRNCLFVCPFILFAFVCAIILFVLAAIGSGASG